LIDSVEWSRFASDYFRGGAPADIINGLLELIASLLICAGVPTTSVRVTPKFLIAKLSLGDMIERIINVGWSMAQGVKVEAGRSEFSNMRRPWLGE
jgi:hypothetical protein